MSKKNFLNYGILNTVFRTVLFAMLILGSITTVMATDYGQISLNTTYNGNITTGNTFDRYTIVLPIAGSLQVNITKGTMENLAANIRWLNASNQTLANTTTNGFNFPYSESMDLEAGTYHIEIVGRGGVGQTGTYSISMACFIDEIEPNNTIEQAQLVPFGYTVTGLITSSDPIDIFRYSVTAPGRFSLNLTKGNVNGLQDMYIRFRDYTGTSIFYINFYSSNSYNYSIDLGVGDYFIEITPYGNNTGTYNLRTEFMPAEINEIEPNNTLETAQIVPFGYTIKGFLNYQDPIDIFQYSITEPGRLFLNVTKGSQGQRT